MSPSPSEDPAESATPNDGPSSGEASALDALVTRLQASRDFPSMAAAMRDINLLAGADETANLRGLSESVQQDYALTQRLLRLVNSSAFRPSGADAVSTVSRAIELLGVNRVRALAASLILFDAGADGIRAQALRDEFLRATTASAIAASVVDASHRLAEEAGLAAMFHRLGRVLLISHMPEEAQQLRRIDSTPGTPAWREAEIRRQLGASLDELGQAVAQSWGFPSILLQGFRRPDPDERIALLHGAPAQVQVACGLAAELCEAIVSGAGLAPAELSRLARRYRANLHLDEQGLLKVVRSARTRTAAFAQSVGLDLAASEFGRRLTRAAATGPAAAGERAAEGDSGIGMRTRQDAASAGGEASPSGASSGAPAAGTASAAAGQVTAALASTLAVLAGQLAEGESMNALVRTTLQGLLEALSCQRVIFATREPDSMLLVARQGRGQVSAASLSHFRVALSDDADLLGVSARKGVDLLITDATDPKIAPRLAAWQRTHFSARSFLSLPVLVDASARALIYADTDSPGGLALDSAALSMLRGIRNQLVLIFRQARGPGAR